MPKSDQQPHLRNRIPSAWMPGLQEEVNSVRFSALCEFLLIENQQGKPPLPPESMTFRALELVPPEKVRVVILGQDPYHGENQAIGLSFGVPNSLFPKPPSLKNIFKELQTDLGVTLDETHSDLSGWANQGVLLLNTVLSVRANEPLSHQNRGWEAFTDRVLRFLNSGNQKIVFVLWGSQAQKKTSLIDQSRHEIIATAHPSPLSAYRGFFGSRVFSRINSILSASGQDPIDWTRVTRP